MMMKPASSITAQLVKSESKEFRFIFAISFLFFLTVVVIARLLPRSWRFWLSQPEQRMSIINETRTVVNTFMPFVYMA